MSGDDERKLDEERSIIADLEHMDAMKAELAAWRKGPWVRKADHEESIARLRARLAAAEAALGKAGVA